MIDRSDTLFTEWCDLINDAGDVIHVVPIQDIALHFKEDCPCQPEHETEGDINIYLHNAWDGRDEIKH